MIASIYILPSSTKFSDLLVCNSLVQILNPMNFWPCDRFLQPLAQRRNKKFCVCGPAFGTSPFLTLGPRFFLVWGFAFGGLGLFRAPRCLDPALKQGTKKNALWGLHFLILGAYNVFWGPWALWGPALKH
jgi:hypothetical protein